MGDLLQGLEEWVHDHVWHGPRALELVAQLLRQKPEDGRLRNLRPLPLPGVLQVPLDANAQGHGHLILLEVPAQVPKLLRGVLLHAAKLSEGVSDASNQVREAHQRADHHKDREGPLCGVVRLHVHRGRRELSNTPVHGRKVLVIPSGALEAVALDPRRARAALQVRDEEPKACDEVVDEEQHGDHLDDVRHDAGGLRIEEVVQRGQDPPQLQQPDEPHGAHEAHDPQQLDSAPSGLARVEGRQGRQGEVPVRYHNS
mmetsp:Transcript_40810/g.113463  ORF Transcript_40810/g.113463 Transcript_40810/m.113463 type:complete len:257 (-) Transcript_40810:1486-2256(-)